LFGFKSVCKNAKSAVKSEKGLLFDAIREQLDKIIEECGFESVPNAIQVQGQESHTFRTLNLVGCVVDTTKRCIQIVQDEDVFKAGADIKIGKNMGTVYVCPYAGEVTGELRGERVDAHQVAAII